MAEHPAPGWYLVRRDSDAALCCLYTAGDGWWAMAGHNRHGLPPGFTLGPSIDELLDFYEEFADRPRPAADPREIAE